MKNLHLNLDFENQKGHLKIVVNGQNLLEGDIFQKDYSVSSTINEDALESYVCDELGDDDLYERLQDIIAASLEIGFCTEEE